MAKALAYFQGKIVPVNEAKVGIMTHALHYGTAVFEGIRGNWNAKEDKMFIFRMREHYVRFLKGCQMMLIDIPHSPDDLCAMTVELLRSCGYKQDLYIRPLAYKSEELVANLRLQDLRNDFTLMMVPFGSYIDTDGAIKCCTSSWRRIDDTIIPSRVKISGHYVNSILAKTEATLAGFDEAIMLTQAGNVSEGTGENLFLISEGVLHTPPVADNNLTGITRDSAIKLSADELNMKVVERTIRRSELYLADEVFLTGTAAHSQPVGSLDNRPIGNGVTGHFTEQILDLYLNVIKGNNPKYRDWCTEVTI